MNANNKETVKSHKVEFVNYTGSYPNLCSGVLTLKIDGKIVELKHCLSSGGSVWFDDDWCEHVEDGPWTASYLPDELKHLQDEISAIANEFIPEGCCGGCI